jgi:hypothetical protein
VGFSLARYKRVSTQFSRVWLISLGSNGGTPPFYLNLGKRVNTIIGGFRTTDFSHYADRPEIPNQALMLELQFAPSPIGRTNRCVQRTLVSKV